MRVERVRATRFLAFPELDLPLDETLTALTGPNGVGKTSVLEACKLLKVALAPEGLGELQELWSSAGWHGSSDFSVRVTINFDHRDEKETLDAFLTAAFVRLLHVEQSSGADILAAATDALGPQPGQALYKGDLIVMYDRSRREPWRAAWEFDVADTRAFVTLLGPGLGTLSEGEFRTADPKWGRSELAPSTNDIAAKIRSGEVLVRLEQIVNDVRVEFHVEVNQNLPTEVPATAHIVGLNPDWAAAANKPIQFRDVLHELLARALVITPNHRSAPRTHFAPSELLVPSDLSDGTMVPAELHRLKNGKVDERAQFATIQALFTRLTSRHFDVVQAADSTHAERIQVIPVETFPGHLDRPEVNIRRFGAGAIEGLYLATILGSPNRVAMLDEPGVHLSPTGQRRLLAALRAHAGERQLVIITHNSDLVPVATEGDLRSVVRLTAAPDAVTVHRSAEDALASSGLQRLIGTPEMRDLLFAAGVVFCEGETDLVLLREWFDSRLQLRRGTPRTTHYDTMAYDELPTTVEANVAILGVGGEQQLRQAAQFVRSFGIPWAMVVDAPALSPSSKLAGWLTANDLLPALDGDVDFATAKSAFAAAGVFTLANHFIDGPGDKSGEIEWFMRELSPREYAEAAKLSPGRGKQAGKGIAVARAFASAVPAPPVVVDLWIDLLNHLSAPASAVAPD